MDESNIQALYGTTYCRIKIGDAHNIDTANEQLEFFSAIGESIGKTSDLSFITAMMHRAQNKPQEQILEALNETLSVHIENSKKLAPGFDF